jgi:holo-[acyl-carrier protein] synthase
VSVLGVGLDVVDVATFSSQLELDGTSFLGSTFTPAELATAAEVGENQGEEARVRHLAARFGAKEAFVKAWSMARLGRAPALASVRWQEIEVGRDAWGRPVLRLTGRTADAVADTLGPVSAALSISHDGPVAAAVVVLDPGAGG